MDALADSQTKCDGTEAIDPQGSKDVVVQLVISLVLGLSAFIGFCILRPRWHTLYAARRRRTDPQIGLPALPDTFLGWLPALYRVTEEQVLASAGLDAFVFLSFFKMAMRLFTVMLFFAAVVLWPINHKYVGDIDLGRPGGNDTNSTSILDSYLSILENEHNAPDRSWDWNYSYLWSYIVFTWFFSFLVLYYLNSETSKIIRVRQDYLGTQSTITDRTFRLTGIPANLRSEEKIKDFIENLEIGNVKSVTLCRNWAGIDKLMVERDTILRKLEEAWSVYQKRSHNGRLPASDEISNTDDGEVENENDDDGEDGRLLAGDSLRNLVAQRRRPTTRIRFGFFKLRSRQTDAIDYYEEKLRRLDDKIQMARKRTYKAASTAFVTMDSVAACQMAMQALVDPRPGELLTKPAPSPADVIWVNTYTSRYRRRLQSWLVSASITILTLLWVFPVAFLASFLSICTIQKVSPSLADSLLEHETTKALVQTALPVLVVSLLNVAVPYVYDFLSNRQGMISQGDVELSVISKNFFFTFFNVFLVFAVSGSAFKFWPVLRQSLNDTQLIARELATSISGLNNFYLNFVMLQGLGLMPLRLLQMGAVFLYPIARMGAKTPRDFAEIVQPDLFRFGFYLPTALLVFILCLVYSILPGAHLILLMGIIYFTLGYFVYKYQLLYSMDQPQHATGGAWRLISYRVITGLIVFQIVMAGILLLQSAFVQAALIAPLLLITVWYSYFWHHRFTPLTMFIALGSIKRSPYIGTTSGAGGVEAEQETPQTRLSRRMSTVDEDREKGMTFTNPNLITPLEQPWIYQNQPPAMYPEEAIAESVNGDENRRNMRTADSERGHGSGSSSFSLGDTHVWREGGENNV